MNKRKVVAIIPARGGSRSVPAKNIKRLNGRPLIYWTIREAKKTPEIDRIIVSTDSKKIAYAAQRYGADVIQRPRALAGHYSPTIDTVRHVLAVLKKRHEEPTHVVLLEPTCPLRASVDIKKCLSFLLGSKSGYDSVATYKEAELNPLRTWKIIHNCPKSFITRSKFWLPRQRLPKVYQLNGAVYAFKASTITNRARHLLNGRCRAVIMPASRTVDIDSLADFKYAEYLMRQKKARGKS